MYIVINTATKQCHTYKTFHSLYVYLQVLYTYWYKLLTPHRILALPHIGERRFVPPPLVTQEHLVAPDAAMIQVCQVIRLCPLDTGVPLGDFFSEGLVDDSNVCDGVLFVCGFNGRFIGKLLQGEGVFRQPCHHKVVCNSPVIHYACKWTKNCQAR